MSLPARLLAVALVAFGLTSAVDASAGPRRGKAHAAAEAPSFPMKPDAYKALVEKRIDKVREAIDKKLDRRGVTPDRKKAIHKILDEEAKDVRAEVAKVSADGTVTEAEAGKVKVLTNGLRARLRERLRAEKDPKAKATLDAIRAKEAKEKADKDKAQKSAKEAAAKAEKDAAVKQAAAKAKAEKEAAVKAAKAKAAKAAQTKPAKAKVKPKAAKKKPAKSAGTSTAL